MKDALGARMKENYEARFQPQLPRRTYTVIRIDGKAFHSYTRPLNKPFDDCLQAAMDAAAMTLCGEMMGCALAYGQSDEYSFLLTDFATDQTQAWFDGKVQKIVSISASIFTAAFLAARFEQGDKRPAHFDSRAFCIPDRVEVDNYFIWRQQDAARNSLNMLASEYYSHRELHGKSCIERHELLHAKGVNWNDLAPNWKRGRVISKATRQKEVTFTHKKTKQEETVTVDESYWRADYEIPVFTKEHGYLDALIPSLKGAL
ncbi:MAG: tRNA(His) guanylyltransferase Thg1 family protein [Acidobacteriales bacterium]|nr:tRNA(His) guanylyltransferase Thg1 family protein [Terriglobales bacterium]